MRRSIRKRFLALSVTGILLGNLTVFSPLQAAVQTGAESPFPVTEQEENITIDGKKYDYIKYTINYDDDICIDHIIQKGDVLTIPAEINGFRVRYVGAGEESYEQNVILEPDKKYKKMVIEEGVEQVSESAFEKMQVEEVVLPTTLKKIGEDAFRESTVKKINLDEVKVIGDSAFRNCTKLQKINLKEKVELGDWVFQDDVSLKKIQLPKKVKTIGKKCFYNTKVEKIRWPIFMESNLPMDEVAQGSLFKGCKKLGKVTFQKEADRVYIPEQAFQGCRKLKKLVFPKGIKQVEYRESTCAKNYTDNVTTLKFQGKNTKLIGGWWNDYANYENDKGEKYITVNKIIAPRNSKAAQFTRKAYCIRKLTDEGYKKLVEEDEDSYYKKKWMKLGKAKLQYLK